MNDTIATRSRSWRHPQVRTRTPLLVWWNDVFQFDMDPADDLRENPGQMLPYFEEALRTFDLPQSVPEKRANVRIRDVNESFVYSVPGVRSAHIGELLGIYGQVAKMTPVDPRLEVAAFECQRCGTMTRIPQSETGNADFQEPHECEGCERQGPFRINFDQSEFVDYQKVRLQQPPEDTKGGKGETIDIHLEHDLVDGVEAGDRATFVGVVNAVQKSDDSAVFDVELDGVGIEIEESDYEEIDVDEIEAIATGEHGSPYDLLVDSIAPKHHGDEHIKLAAALQLFGGWKHDYPDGTSDRGDFHVLLLGDPGTGKSSFLRTISNIAPRSQYASGKGASAAGLTAAAVRDNFGDGEQWTLEAGALVLANKGLACVDEIDKMDEEAVSSMHDALESQTVSINKADINATLPAQTSLLAGGNPKYGRFDQYEPIGEQIDLGPTLLSRFDLHFMLTDQPSPEKDEEIVEHMIDSRQAAAEYTLDESGDTIEKIEPAIDRDVLRAYVAHAKRSCFPMIKDQEVKQYLRDCFMEIRISGTKDNPVPVTFRKLEGLQRLAEASARVRLSDEVTMDDVDRALKLVRLSMQDVGIDPESGEMDVDIIETGQSKSQRETVKWLQDYIQENQDEGDKTGVFLDELRDAAATADYDPERAEHELEKLLNKGDAYYPGEDRVAIP